MEGELRQHDGMVVVELVVLQQGFAKHCERRGGRGVALRQERGRLVFLAAPKPPLYIGEGEGLRPHLGFPPKGCGQP